MWFSQLLVLCDPSVPHRYCNFGSGASEVKKLSSKKDLCENKEKQTTVMLQAMAYLSFRPKLAGNSKHALGSVAVETDSEPLQMRWCGPGFTDLVTGGCAAMQRAARPHWRVLAQDRLALGPP